MTKKMIRNLHHTAFLSLFMLALAVASNQAFAQDSQPQEGAQQQETKKLSDLFSTIDISTITSLLFTGPEHREVIIARRSAGNVRAPESSPKDGSVPGEEDRYVHLQGIVYTSKEDWVIWLNGVRIAPDALPKEALSIEVYRNYIEIRWYDDFTNQIIPLRLRPLQKFNIDTRTFLPG